MSYSIKYKITLDYFAWTPQNGTYPIYVDLYKSASFIDSRPAASSAQIVIFHQRYQLLRPSHLGYYLILQESSPFKPETPLMIVVYLTEHPANWFPTRATPPFGLSIILSREPHTETHLYQRVSSIRYKPRHPGPWFHNKSVKVSPCLKSKMSVPTTRENEPPLLWAHLISFMPIYSAYWHTCIVWDMSSSAEQMRCTEAGLLEVRWTRGRMHLSKAQLMGQVSRIVSDIADLFLNDIENLSRQLQMLPLI